MKKEYLEPSTSYTLIDIDELLDMTVGSGGDGDFEPDTPGGAREGDFVYEEDENE